jgi:hypothetical protein
VPGAESNHRHFQSAARDMGDCGSSTHEAAPGEPAPLFPWLDGDATTPRAYIATSASPGDRGRMLSAARAAAGHKRRDKRGACRERRQFWRVRDGGAGQSSINRDQSGRCGGSIGGEDEEGNRENPGG